MASKALLSYGSPGRFALPGRLAFPAGRGNLPAEAFRRRRVPTEPKAYLSATAHRDGSPYPSRWHHRWGEASLPSRVAAIFVLVALVACGAFAQSYPLYTPVHIGTSAQIHDEFGNLLKGSAATSPSKRDLVQVLWASNSVINPPAYDGTPDPNNPPVEGGTTGIGDLVSPTFITPARFCVSLADPRPPQSSRIFVRVFNAPTAAAASFYTDSQLLRVNNNDLLMADFGSTTNPIDPRDFDGDGLNNSWEKSLFSDPNKWDTDGDGVNDAEEFLSETDLLDPDSAFVTVWLETDAANDAILTWDSVAGMTYQVQHTGFKDASLSYSNVSATIVADGSRTQTTVTNGMAESFGKYRVRLLPKRQL